MINLDDLQLIGQGATSDVYLYDNNKILKLFNNKYSIGAVNYEAGIAKAISETDIKAPKYYQTIIVNNRHGIVYDYIPGCLVYSVLLDDLKSSVKIIKKLAGIQYEINQKTATSIPDQCTRLSHLIERTNIEQSYKDIIIKALQTMPQANHICHGDFHVGNIISSDNDFYTIDWMNCYKGHLEGDVLRSYLMLVSPYVSIKLSFVKKFLFIVYKNVLGYIYLNEYLKKAHLKKRSLRKWWPIIAAARLADNVPNEEDWLKRKIRRNIKYLTTASI